MISSVSNNLNQFTSELLATKQATKTTTDSDGKETVDTSLFDTEAAPNTDTLEISPEGLAAAYAQTSTDTTSTDTSTLTEASVPPPAPPVSSTEETAETDSSSTTTDLSSYTEDELDALVEDGTITEMEKNAELANRAMEESLEKNQEKQMEQLNQTDEAKGPRPPKPEDEVREDLPPVGDDLALTEGAATEDDE
jgi:hypothetical protein